MSALTWVKMEIGEQKLPPPGGLPSEADMEFTIDAVDASGRIRYHWTLEEYRRGTPGSDSKLERIEGLTGIVARGGLDAKGVGHDLDIEGQKDTSIRSRRLLTGISEGVRRLWVPLPDEPVGVGAKWNVTEMNTVAGVRFTGTTRYELLSVEGWRIHVRFYSALHALGEDVFPPGVEGFRNIRAKSHTATCEGESHVDLTRLVPQPSKFRTETRMEAAFTREGAERRLLKTSTVETKFERR